MFRSHSEYHRIVFFSWVMIRMPFSPDTCLYTLAIFGIFATFWDFPPTWFPGEMTTQSYWRLFKALSIGHIYFKNLVPQRSGKLSCNLSNFLNLRNQIIEGYFCHIALFVTFMDLHHLPGSSFSNLLYLFTKLFKFHAFMKQRNWRTLRPFLVALATFLVLLATWCPLEISPDFDQNWNQGLWHHLGIAPEIQSGCNCSE